VFLPALLAGRSAQEYLSFVFSVMVKVMVKGIAHALLVDCSEHFYFPTLLVPLRLLSHAPSETWRTTWPSQGLHASGASIRLPPA